MHAGVFSVLHKSKFSFNSVVQLVDRFKSYLTLTNINMLGTEFALYQSLRLNEISSKAKAMAIPLKSIDSIQLMATNDLSTGWMSCGITSTESFWLLEHPLFHDLLSRSYLQHCV